MQGGLDAQPVEATPEKPTSQAGELTPVNNDLFKLSVARSLGISKLDDMQHHSNRLEWLVKWAEGKGAKDEVSVIAEIKNFQNRLGNPTIHDLYVYTQLDAQRNELESKMRKFEKQ